MNPPPATHEHPVPLSVDGQPALFPTMPYRMGRRVPAFLADEQRQRFVNAATLKKDNQRKACTKQTFGDRHDEWRQLASSIKRHTIGHLDLYLDRFAANARNAGATVHFAADNTQANAICLDIARREGSTLCVKSKSMVTEETHLVPALQAMGVETVETDLGEFILQLDGDAPSHIVTPMIHKNRESVGRAFERTLGVEYTDDPATLTQTARRYLREKFRRADLGITGGNFLVASTGSIVTCTNEGNGRLSASAPRVQVVFVGIEKLVPDLRSLGVMLKMLARHSTAQPLTVYNHIMTGPRRSHEHDGPEQLHIVVIDNGRTGILADPDYRESLNCIRCGACLNACPVYRKATGHGYGAVYSGPIGSILTPLFRGMANYSDLPHASSLCGACYEACPVRIDIPQMLIKLRRDMLAARITGLRDRLSYRAFASVLRSPELYRAATALQRRVLRSMADRDGYIRSAPGPLRQWTAQRDMAAPAAQPFRAWWNQRQRDRQTGANHG